MTIPNPFQKPTTPKNGLELLKWAILEPLIFEKFFDNLSKREDSPIEHATILTSNQDSKGFLHLIVSELKKILLLVRLIYSFIGWLILIFFSVSWLILGLIASLEDILNLSKGRSTLIVIVFIYYLLYFRFPFYLYHFLKIFSNLDFYHNPYIHDGVIWFPLPTVTDRLTRLAAQQPDIALAFVDFLLEYRPLQRKLAMHILHAATAGQWARFPLDADQLLPPSTTKDMPKFIPSDDWTHQLALVRQQLIGSQLQSNIGLRKTEFEKFSTRLTELRELTLRESLLWHRYYLDALDKWLTVAQEELDKLTTEAKIREPISSNSYRPGEALNPDSVNVFFGRNDLRDDLARKILTSQNMPLFLIQGQRRVGKTSLLNFLPQLLGSRFKVIYQDCQDERVNGIIPWLQDCRRRLQEQLNLPATDWQSSQNWLTAWGEFKQYLATLSLDKNCKLILAFDEYEKLHRYFQKNVEEAEELLAAMRSFSQHQNQIVFLFVGAHLFSELQNPNWSKYFVQVERLKVDYLKKSEALQLVTEPVELIYPPEIPEQMFALTQGHPALLQKLCREMVDIANADLRRQMTQQDLEKALEITLDRENLAIGVFWTEFCEDPACKATVKQILAHQPPTDQYHLLRLAEHGYIIQENGVWQLRVPLFKQWLERYAEAFR